MAETPENPDNPFVMDPFADPEFDPPDISDLFATHNAPRAPSLGSLSSLEVGENGENGGGSEQTQQTQPTQPNLEAMAESVRHKVFPPGMSRVQREERQHQMMQAVQNMTIDAKMFFMFANMGKYKEIGRILDDATEERNPSLPQILDNFLDMGDNADSPAMRFHIYNTVLHHANCPVQVERARAMMPNLAFGKTGKSSKVEQARRRKADMRRRRMQKTQKKTGNKGSKKNKGKGKT